MDVIVKKWWESKTAWIQIVAFVFAIGSAFSWWPKDIDQNEVVGAIMAVVAVITFVLRLTGKTVVASSVVVEHAKDNLNTEGTVIATLPTAEEVKKGVA